MTAESSVLRVEALRALATEAGFDLCGFARAEPLPAAFLSSWLEAGFAADMDWLGARAAERLDVAQLLPGARTVIVFACNYWHPDPPEGSLIARYARGRDYHWTLRDRLRHFRRLLRAAHPTVQDYGCIDHGPLMEKVWAARAGLGYVAKSGCLITPEYGSYVVLCALILDAEVDGYGDGPAADRCGGCTLCIKSCPTDAIGVGGVVDARACLSYQTIENRNGEVPAALRHGLSETVFGCDICQDVCPLNRRPVAGGERFAPRAVSALGVRELAGLSRADYDALVPGTPLARAKYDGLRRNAAYALGALRDEGARALLERLADDPAPLVRTAAAWALEQLGRPGGE